MRSYLPADIPASMTVAFTDVPGRAGVQPRPQTPVEDKVSVALALLHIASNQDVRLTNLSL